ncbi:hypothetical protein A4R35_21305 [Thermogemmatispora tikiterensis]|uniref:CRISPR-associated protein Cas6 C-terminal domain-containing protein n=2 Tax=Thermogemmatispora tikiterensis TaxID=1825093 RepID=A0A328VPH8_9CHLR|nr:hypothetical protein A4R35_21305 [Thermogemmatispora tikiterensis]
MTKSQLAIYPLRFTVEVQTPLKLTRPYGAQLRGALYEALLRSSCTTQQARSSGISSFHKDCLCPVHALMTPLRDETLTRGVKGGRDQPRPYVIRPPQEVPPVYYPGQHFTFELLLFGQSIDLLPYLIQAIPQLEQAGLGASPGEHQNKRGRFRIRRLESYHPFTGAHAVLYTENRINWNAQLKAVTSTDISQRAAQLPSDRITIHFLSPLRLIADGQLVHEHQLSFAVLVHRLFKRLRDLEEAYSSGAQPAFLPEHHPYLKQAEQIACQHIHTGWYDDFSYSRRRGASSPIGGIIGYATFTGELQPFRELLTWGELCHVGRSCVKGNGHYRLMPPPD